MAYRPQYLERFRGTRKPRPIGEVFAMKLRGLGYVFGRVVRDSCAWGPSHSSEQKGRLELGTYIVYIYKGISKSLDQEPRLTLDNLLIPPQIIFGHGWNMGYFVPVRQAPLTPDDVLPVHCFWSSPFELFVDEFGRTLSERVEPCGDMGLGSYGTIERSIALAYGLPYDDPAAAPTTESTTSSDTHDSQSEIEPLDEKKFWKIIEDCKRRARGDRDTFLELFEDSVSEWQVSDLRALQMRIDELLERAFTWDLWGAAFIMNGGCSEDCFLYWRCWLIAQGRAVYEAALGEAESLASRKLVLGEPEGYLFEELLNSLRVGLESATDDGVDGKSPRGSKPRGHRWTERSLPKRFPKLWHKFAHTWC